MEPVTDQLIPIQLDKERRLCFDMNASALLEEKHKINLLDGSAFKTPSAKTVTVILWALLLYDDPELKLDNMAAVMRGYNVKYVFDHITLAINPDSQAAKGTDKTVTPVPVPLLQ